MSRAFGPYWEQTLAFLQSGGIFHGGVKECLEIKLEGKISRNLFALDTEACSRVSKHFTHMMAVSAVDNFNSFLSELVFEILEKDPRPISGKSFPIKSILEHDDINELKRSVIERFIVDLGYQNIDDLSTFLVSNFGITSLSRPLTRLRLRRLIQITNIITHNRGVVNQVYLTRSSSKRDEIGKLVWAPHPVKFSSYLTTLVEAIDQEATAKFALEKSNWEAPWVMSRHE